MSGMQIGAAVFGGVLVAAAWFVYLRGIRAGEGRTLPLSIPLCLLAAGALFHRAFS